MSSDRTPPPVYNEKPVKKVKLTKELLEAHFMYSQEEAAVRLGVSLSTLKRKFRSLKIGKRWPFQEKRQRERKRSISFILNTIEPTSSKRLDYRTINALAKAFADSINQEARQSLTN
jgi:hypothetical protein